LHWDARCRASASWDAHKPPMVGRRRRLFRSHCAHPPLGSGSGAGTPEVRASSQRIRL
jgi:hypothetical protein